MTRIFLAILLFANGTTQVLAWGEEGHSIVAEIAQRRLSPGASDAIVKILKTDPNAPNYAAPSLASIATWADEVRYKADGTPNETYNWHFVDIPGLMRATIQRRSVRRRIRAKAIALLPSLDDLRMNCDVLRATSSFEP